MSWTDTFAGDIKKGNRKSNFLLVLNNMIALYNSIAVQHEMTGGRHTGLQAYAWSGGVANGAIQTWPTANISLGLWEFNVALIDTTSNLGAHCSFRVDYTQINSLAFLVQTNNVVQPIGHLGQAFLQFTNAVGPNVPYFTVTVQNPGPSGLLQFQFAITPGHTAYASISGRQVGDFSI